MATTTRPTSSGAPLSATQQGTAPPPLPLPTSSSSLILQSSASFRIRAPVTADSDSSDFDSETGDDSISDEDDVTPLTRRVSVKGDGFRPVVPNPVVEKGETKAVVIARLSIDYDDDEELFSEVSDEENSAVSIVARVPSLEKTSQARVRYLGFGEEDTEEDEAIVLAEASENFDSVGVAELETSTGDNSGSVQLLEVGMEDSVVIEEHVAQEENLTVAGEDVDKQILTIEPAEVEESEVEKLPEESSGENNMVSAEENEHDDTGMTVEEEDSNSMFAAADAGSATRPTQNVEILENEETVNSEEEEDLQGEKKLLISNADMEERDSNSTFAADAGSATRPTPNVEILANEETVNSEEEEDLQGEKKLLISNADMEEEDSNSMFAADAGSATRPTQNLEILENEETVNSEEEEDLQGEKELLISDAVMEEDSTFGGGGFEDSQSDSRQMIADEDVETEMEVQGKELLDSAALAALLKEGSESDSSGSSSFTASSDDESREVSPEWSADTGSSSFRGITVPPLLDSPQVKLSDDNLVPNWDSVVKFSRLVYRLGYSLQRPIAAQVIYGLVGGGYDGSQELSFESADKLAMELEGEGKVGLDFSLNILVIGKTGVGKSSTINSIFGEKKAVINAFEPATTNVKEICGTVSGIRIRILDTPGFRPSFKQVCANRKILASIKKFTKKFPPDVVLYVDRLDDLSSDQTDVTLLSEVTKSLGSSIWENAIVVLTHASSLPPEGPSGSPLSLDSFFTRRCNVVHEAISQAAGDRLLMQPSMRRPVALAENRKESISSFNWTAQLLLMCCSVKILSEAISEPKLQEDIPRHVSRPLLHLVSALLQPRSHPKLTYQRGGDDVDSDMEVDEDDDHEYEQHPPSFKPLSKSQVDNLGKEQIKAYFDEYDYRLKDEADEDGGGAAASEPVPLPDFSRPPSFDGDSPSFRYRALESTSRFLVRPVMDSNGWDHDYGYDGLSIERNLSICNQFPGELAVQITKDKKQLKVHFESSVCAKHGGRKGSTIAGLDIQTIGEHVAYVLRSETKVSNSKVNKTAAGMSITLLGKNMATGIKIEDEIEVGKLLALVGSAGAVRSGTETAYGANFEVRVKRKELFAEQEDHSRFSVSLTKGGGGDLSLIANLQTQVCIRRSSKMDIGVWMNNKRRGQISFKTGSSPELQIALLGVVPVAMAVLRIFFPAMKS